MTQYLFPPDPHSHWSDALAEEAGQQWQRQHRLRWLWLRLRERLQASPRPSELEPGEGRCPDLPEPELDPEESARIRRAWLQHISRTRTRTIGELISKRQEEEQRRRERWSRGLISPEELEQQRRQRAAEERMQRQLQLLMRLSMWLLPTCRTTREMQTCWLAAPSRPVVMLSVRWIYLGGIDDWDASPGCCDVTLWRRGVDGRLELMSRQMLGQEQAYAMWRQRRARGWRLVPPQG